MDAATLIHIPTWGSVSLVELIWTISGVVALIFSALDFHQAMIDKIFVDEVGQNGIMKILADGYVRRAASRIVASFAILTVGVYAMVTSSFAHYIPPSGIIITIALFILSLHIVHVASSDYFQRKEIQKMFSKRDEKGGDTNERGFHATSPQSPRGKREAV